jgi:hypothetical protein
VLLGDVVQTLIDGVTHLREDDLILIEIAHHVEVHLIECLHHHIELGVLEDLAFMEVIFIYITIRST